MNFIAFLCDNFKNPISSGSQEGTDPSTSPKLTYLLVPNLFLAFASDTEDLKKTYFIMNFGNKLDNELALSLDEKVWFASL